MYVRVHVPRDDSIDISAIAKYRQRNLCAAKISCERNRTWLGPDVIDYLRIHTSCQTLNDGTFALLFASEHMSREREGEIEINRSDVKLFES